MKNLEKEKPVTTPKAKTPEAPPSAESKEAVASPADDLTKQIQAAEEEAKNHYDKLLRVMAEFENFKKRILKEQEERLTYANEKLLVELLPVLDDLDRVLDHLPLELSEETKKIAVGIELVRKNWLAVLEKFGLKEVPAQEELFDPAKHEALAAVESEEHPPQQILAVHRKGYWLGERLLRPVLVTVAKEKS